MLAAILPLNGMGKDSECAMLSVTECERHLMIGRREQDVKNSLHAMGLTKRRVSTANGYVPTVMDGFWSDDYAHQT
jgi:hypothetical protein